MLPDTNTHVLRTGKRRNSFVLVFLFIHALLRVPIDLLYGAMRSEDPVSGKTRGYIIIDDPRGHNDSSSSDDEIPWYVILVVSLGATSYICFTCIAIVLICASLLTVIKRRGKRTRPDVAI